MTAYTLFGQPATAGSLDNSTEILTNGLQFSVSTAAAKLTAFWFFTTTGDTQLPTHLALFDGGGTLVAGTEDTAPSWSGAAASGWVKYTFASPVTLTPGTTYTAAVSNDPTSGNKWYTITSGYWSGSGVTNGPLSCPNQPNTFDDFTWGFPAGAFGNFNIWLDVEVTTPDPAVSPPRGLPPVMFPPLSRSFGPNPPFEVPAPSPGSAAVTFQGTATASGQGSVTTAAVQQAPATAAGQGAVTAAAAQQAVSSAAGQGQVTTAAVQGAAGSGAAGQGTITTASATQAAAAPAGQGQVAGASAAQSGGTITGAGSVTAPASQVQAPAAAAGQGAVTTAAAQRAPAAAAGQGSVSSASAIQAPATAAGQGQVGDAAAQQAPAAAAGQGAVTTAATTAAGATAAGQGQVAASTAPAGTGTAAGAGQLAATAAQQAPAVLAGQGTVTTAAAALVTVVLTGAGSVTATPALTVAAAITGHGSVTAAGQAISPVQLGYAAAGLAEAPTVTGGDPGTTPAGSVAAGSWP